MPAEAVDFDVAVIGAGSVGIAVAYYLVKTHGQKNVVLLDPRDPMSLTSAQSGENYRNWWPHPVMTAFTDHSISLMEEIDRESGGRLNMTRGGYALVTRRSRPDDLIEELHRGYGATPDKVRIRETGAGNYLPPLRAPWSEAPDGVDVLLDRDLIQRTFPAFASDVATVIHIRRAGSISAQQLGQYMLEAIRACGGRLIRGEVKAISTGAPFVLDVAVERGSKRIRADRVVNAAGPFLRDVGVMLGEEIGVKCVYQQKVAFPDHEGAVPRDMPFTIDLDGQSLAWSDEDRQLLAGDPATRHLVEPMNGGIHCRARRAREWHLDLVGLGLQRDGFRPPRRKAHGCAVSGHGASRSQPPQSPARLLHRAPAEGRAPLWRLLHDDRGELAAHRQDEDRRGVHRGRAFGIRVHGRVCRGSDMRGLGDRIAGAGVRAFAVRRTPCGPGLDGAACRSRQGQPLRWPPRT
ncbi:MAG: FAD-binding oxidoreductase [Betaproteobacteria bacterium]|nr:FAD-binding oxidoreductase [Betaproteobacteria bacterium]